MTMTMRMEAARKKGRVGVPVGYVFKPSGKELMVYLVHHVNMLKEPLPLPMEIVTGLDLYGEHSNPWTVLDECWRQEEFWYVLTELKKAGEGQSRIKRLAGVGTWKEQNSKDVRFRYNGMVIRGKNRNLVFQPQKSAGATNNYYCRATHGHWIMNEYSLLLNHQQEYYSSWVICQIRNKDYSSSQSSSKRSRLMFQDHTDHIHRQLNIDFGLKKMRSVDHQEDQVPNYKTMAQELVPAATHVDQDHDDQVPIYKTMAQELVSADHDGVGDDFWISKLSFDETLLNNLDDHDQNQQIYNNICPQEEEEDYSQQAPSTYNMIINVAEDDHLLHLDYHHDIENQHDHHHLLLPSTDDHDRAVNIDALKQINLEVVTPAPIIHQVSSSTDQNNKPLDDNDNAKDDDLLQFQPANADAALDPFIPAALNFSNEDLSDFFTTCDQYHDFPLPYDHQQYSCYPQADHADDALLSFDDIWV